MTISTILLVFTLHAFVVRPVATQTDDNEYSLRLVSENNKTGDGVLEITYKGTSGAICPDGWDDKDARVVCKEFGFQHGTARIRSKSVSGIDGPYLTTNVDCNGTENLLGQCKLTPFGEVNNCQPGETYKQVAGVRCYNFDVQLFPNPENPYGAVVFNPTGGSRLLCSDGFDQNSATVVCKQLGFRFGLSACCSAFGPVELDPRVELRFTTDTIGCNGTEQHLSECTYSNEAGDKQCTKSVTVGNECQQFCKASPGEPCNKHYSKYTRCSWSRYAGVVCSNEARGITSVSADPIVKINYFTHDGYVCTEDFTDKDANVVCKTIGFQYGIAFKASSLGVMHEIKWLRGLGCTGTESSVNECNHHEWGQTENCQWDSVAAAICSNNQGDLDVKIRVVDGREQNTPDDTSISGRVEIFLNGQWGTICGQYLNRTEAIVLCRQLGYQGGKRLPAGSYGPGTGHVILSGIDCEGNEASIRDCVWYGYSENTCEHSLDAAITCFKNVRLSGTEYHNYGILEMFDYGYSFPEEWWNITEDSFKWYDLGWLTRNADSSKWWAICDTNDNLDATRICKQWGYSTGAFKRGSIFGPTSTELSDVERYCSDANDNACPYNKFTGTCPSGRYMALQCGQRNIQKEEFELLNLPLNSFYGPVTVRRYRKTGYVCSVGFDDNDAHVVCSELGYTSGKAVQSFASNYEIIQAAVECTGKETRLDDCTRGSFSDKTCPASDIVAAVICYKETVPKSTSTTEDKTRPANIQLKVTVDNTQMFLSSSNFDDHDASVYCRSLGFAGGINTVGSTGQSDQSHVSDLKCLGNESSVLECPANWDPILMSEDLGPRASAECRPEVFLIGPGESFYGAVVLTTSKGTGLVSARGFGDTEANTVCRALGYDKGLKHCCDPHGPMTEEIFLTYFRCSGTGNKLSDDCAYDVAFTYKSGTKEHSKYASVVCYNESTKLGYSLSVGQGDAFGPLIFTYLNIDGFICSDGWDDKDANVACRELGMDGGMAYAGELSSGKMKGPFWTSNVDCSGTEDKLENCSITSFGQVDECNKKPSFASVICYGSEGIQYRLSGNESRQGQVEMNILGEWKAICAEHWTNTDAHILCKMLNYTTGHKFETPNTKLYTDISFKCKKTNISLNDCLEVGRRCSRASVGAGAFCYHSVKLSTGVGRETKHGDVLLYHGGQWRSVCSDGFTKTSARVVCKELGFADGDTKCCSSGDYLAGIPQLQTDQVICTGDETMVSDCLVEGTCKSQRNANVVCYDAVQSEPDAQDQQNSITTVIIVVITVIVVVSCISLIIFTTFFCIRRRKRRQHNLNVKYSSAAS